MTAKKILGLYFEYKDKTAKEAELPFAVPLVNPSTGEVVNGGVKVQQGPE
jgi:hypothetical protein